MIWAVSKCCTISSNINQPRLILAVREVPNGHEAEYTGMSLVFGSLSPTRSLQRIVAATKRLNQLTISFRARSFSMKTRRSLIGSLIRPMVDYGSHLLTEDPEVEENIDNLLSKCASWCSRTVGQKLAKRAKGALQIDLFKAKNWKMLKQLKGRLRHDLVQSSTEIETIWAFEILKIFEKSLDLFWNKMR